MARLISPKSFAALISVGSTAHISNACPARLIAGFEEEIEKEEMRYFEESCIWHSAATLP